MAVVERREREGMGGQGGRWGRGEVSLGQGKEGEEAREGWNRDNESCGYA